jgi:spore germination protein KC
VIKRVREVLLVILACSLSLTGCWDRIELEDVAWVQAMGFDVGADGYLATTLQIGIPHSLRSAIMAGGGQGPEYLTITVNSKTALEALDLASVNLGRRVSLVHTQAFFFGEELARRDIRGLAGAMDRYKEIRGTALMAVVKGKAEDLLRLDTSPLETSPSRFIQTLLQQHAHTGLFKASSFVRDFVNHLESSAEAPHAPLIGIAADYKPSSGSGGGGPASTPADQYPPAPQVGEELEEGKIPPPLTGPAGSSLQTEAGMLPKLGGGPVAMLGTAVFAGGKMVGTLTGEETRALLAVQNDFERGSYAIPDPEKPDDIAYSLGFTVHRANSDIDVERNGDKVKIGVRLDIEASYMSPKTQTDYTDPRLIYRAESALANYIKHHLDTAITRTQQEMRVDPFGFGRYVKGTFLTWPEWEAFEWHNKYPDAEIVTEVVVKVLRYGLDLGPLQVPQWEKTRAKESQ